MAALSLLCSLLLFLTAWTGVSILILGPLSIYCGWKSYKQKRARAISLGGGARLLALTPMLIAIAAIPLALIFVGATYRA